METIFGTIGEIVAIREDEVVFNLVSSDDEGDDAPDQFWLEPDDEVMIYVSGE